ncbi:sugar transferase [Leifsonia shinshuensis]|uniref:Exopolysaccharide biosynthesis polyprenyl glycosylphosphotransferase n=1 Tax=Leifsonia shinshuensis TaxID=150026 RepID=A0A853CZK8_9MICO|nr:sugar transferase [Leifsonia shinshuensis]NYJ25323.1 exopolysaccharide biosynthesis polyprenyl glycosylphosphotransferase [Leifsonia shinshuensis]
MMVRTESQLPHTLAGRLRAARALLVADVLVIGGALATAHLVRFGSRNDPAQIGPLDTSYVMVSIVLGVLWLVLVVALDGYRTWPRRLNGPSYWPPVRASAWLVALLAVASLALQLDLSRAYLGFAIPIGLLGLLAVRSVSRWWIYAHRARRYTRRALVVGTPERVAELAGVFAERAAPVAVDVVATTGVENAHGPYLRQLVEEHRIDIIVLTEERDGANVRQLLWDVEGAGAVVWLSIDVPELAAPRAEYHPIDRLPIIEVAPADRSITRRRAKRAFDIVLSSVALTLLLPVIVVCAVLIRLDSPGPAFFRQARIGRGGKTFGIVKLRTMRVDAEKQLAALQHRNEGAGPLFKIKDDPRVTRVGGFLRRTSIDELPQLWNVLKGEMSLVGPLPTEVAEYDRDSHRRLIVKPGMTGLWQVSGRSDLTWEQGVRLDLFYVENWSVAGDLGILFQTVGVVLRPNGAY